MIATAAYLIAFAVVDAAYGISSGGKSPSLMQSDVHTPGYNGQQPLTPVLDTLDSEKLMVSYNENTVIAANTELSGAEPDQPSQELELYSGRPASSSTAEDDKRLILSLEYLIESNVAGPWMQAFSVEERDLKDLNDILGNLLELYKPGESQPTCDIHKIRLARNYESLSGTPQSTPSQVLATSNSSPALTLASNATPVHAVRDEPSHDFEGASGQVASAVPA